MSPTTWDGPVPTRDGPVPIWDGPVPARKALSPWWWPCPSGGGWSLTHPSALRGSMLTGGPGGPRLVGKMSTHICTLPWGHADWLALGLCVPLMSPCCSLSVPLSPQYLSLSPPGPITHSWGPWAPIPSVPVTPVSPSPPEVPVIPGSPKSPWHILHPMVLITLGSLLGNIPVIPRSPSPPKPKCPHYPALSVAVTTVSPSPPHQCPCHHGVPITPCQCRCPLGVPITPNVTVTAPAMSPSPPPQCPCHHGVPTCSSPGWALFWRLRVSRCSGMSSHRFSTCRARRSRGTPRCRDGGWPRSVTPACHPPQSPRAQTDPPDTPRSSRPPSPTQIPPTPPDPTQASP